MQKHPPDRASSSSDTASRRIPYKHHSELKYMTILPSMLTLFCFRCLSAFFTPVLDCDETFNYIEPLHMLMYGYGMQTWEYAPIFALRSWVFLYIHAFICHVGHFLGIGTAFGKVGVLVFLKVVLALFSSLCQAYFIQCVSKRFGTKIGRILLFVLLFATGMTHSAHAILPQSFVMNLLFVIYGLWLNSCTIPHAEQIRQLELAARRSKALHREMLDYYTDLITRRRADPALDHNQDDRVGFQQPGRQADVYPSTSSPLSSSSSESGSLGGVSPSSGSSNSDSDHDSDNTSVSSHTLPSEPLTASPSAAESIPDAMKQFENEVVQIHMYMMILIAVCGVVGWPFVLVLLLPILFNICDSHFHLSLFIRRSIIHVRETIFALSVAKQVTSVIWTTTMTPWLWVLRQFFAHVSPTLTGPITKEDEPMYERFRQELDTVFAYSDIVYYSRQSLMARCWNFTKIILVGLFTLLVLSCLDAIANYYHYGRFTLSFLNVALYNTSLTLDGADLLASGQNLYGTEPLSFYLINIFLNFNIGMLVASIFLCLAVALVFLTSIFSTFRVTVWILQCLPFVRSVPVDLTYPSLSDIGSLKPVCSDPTLGASSKDREGSLLSFSLSPTADSPSTSGGSEPLHGYQHATFPLFITPDEPFAYPPAFFRLYSILMRMQSHLFTMLPMLFWFAAMFPQAHKEERFLYVIYPLFALAISFGYDLILECTMYVRCVVCHFQSTSENSTPVSVPINVQNQSLRASTHLVPQKQHTVLEASPSSIGSSSSFGKPSRRGEFHRSSTMAASSSELASPPPPPGVTGSPRPRESYNHKSVLRLVFDVVSYVFYTPVESYSTYSINLHPVRTPYRPWRGLTWVFAFTIALVYASISVSRNLALIYGYSAPNLTLFTLFSTITANVKITPLSSHSSGPKAPINFMTRWAPLYTDYGLLHHIDDIVRAGVTNHFGDLRNPTDFHPCLFSPEIDKSLSIFAPASSFDLPHDINTGHPHLGYFSYNFIDCMHSYTTSTHAASDTVGSTPHHLQPAANPLFQGPLNTTIPINTNRLLGHSPSNYRLFSLLEAVPGAFLVNNTDVGRLSYLLSNVNPHEQHDMSSTPQISIYTAPQLVEYAKTHLSKQESTAGELWADHSPTSANRKNPYAVLNQFTAVFPVAPLSDLSPYFHMPLRSSSPNALHSHPDKNPVQQHFEQIQPIPSHSALKTLVEQATVVKLCMGKEWYRFSSSFYLPAAEWLHRDQFDKLYAHNQSLREQHNIHPSTFWNATESYTSHVHFTSRVHIAGSNVGTWVGDQVLVRPRMEFEYLDFEFDGILPQHFTSLSPHSSPWQIVADSTRSSSANFNNMNKPDHSRFMQDAVSQCDFIIEPDACSMSDATSSSTNSIPCRFEQLGFELVNSVPMLDAQTSSSVTRAFYILNYWAHRNNFLPLNLWMKKSFHHSSARPPSILPGS